MIGTDRDRKHRAASIPAMYTVFGWAIIEQSRANWAVFAVAPCGCRSVECYGPDIIVDLNDQVEMVAIRPSDPT